MKSLFRHSLVSLLIFMMSMPAMPLTLKINEGRLVRAPAEDGFLNPKAYLAKGTEVTIPDEFINKHFKGDKRNEMAIIKWLSNPKSIPVSKFTTKGSTKTKRDFFVPITVKGSKKDGFVSLRSLARRGGVELVTTTDTAFLDDQEVDAIENENKIIAESENPLSEDIKAVPTCDKSGIVDEHLADILNLDNNTKDIVNALNKEIRENSQNSINNRATPQKVIDNFNKTCAPYEFNQFYNRLRVKAKESNIPSDLLLGIMTQESSGKCNAVKDEYRGTKSIGLFQIHNGGSEQYPTCGPTIKSMLDENCLENPIANLDNAIHVLKQKYKLVNDTYPKLDSQSITKLSVVSRDKWRKAVSAYNGGQGYIYQGHKDISKFNNLYGTKLDPQNWKVRRTFMLRRAIEERGGKLFDRKVAYRYNRQSENTIHNLDYVDSVMTSDIDGDAPGHAAKWLKFINNY